MDRLSNLSFAHPHTHERLIRVNDGYSTMDKKDVFPLTNGIPYFISSKLQQTMEQERSGFMNNLKTFLRRFPRLYVALIYIISPICFVGISPQIFLRRFTPGNILLSIGSGIHRYRSDIINIDMYPYKEVDVVADAMALPFETGSVDGVICEYLIEHVPQPQQVIDEIFRVLKPGGQAYIAAPFVYPFHACPDDYWRWSGEGMQTLCGAEKILKVGPRSGPTSALIAELTTWAAITLSCGSTALYNLLSIVFMLMLWPLKWLDVIVGRFPTAIHGCGSFYIICEKESGNRKQDTQRSEQS